MIYRKRRRRTVIFIIEMILLAVLAFGLYAVSKLNKISGEKIDLNDIFVSDAVAEGYQNIALFGVDSREGNSDDNSHLESSHSDTIMVASINNETKEVKIVSVYRDSYLDNGEGEYRKATEAYYFGGPQRAISMLNANLDLDITDYVTVDFTAVAEVVDLLGGIEIELDSEEVEQLNHVCKETSRVTGKDYDEIPYPGTYLLNGVQATAYARIRYTTGNDYRRTERQRLVIEKIVEKVKQSNIITINSIVDEILPMVSTSMSSKAILDMAADVFSYELGENTGFPFDKDTMDMGSKGDCVIPVTLESNVRQLHTFLFENEEYEPSETVRANSNEIIYQTGLQ